MVALVLAVAFLTGMAVWQLPAALQQPRPPWPGDAGRHGARRRQNRCPGRRVLSAAPPCCICTHMTLVKFASHINQSTNGKGIACIKGKSCKTVMTA
jgi:hypothetical protein